MSNPFCDYTIGIGTYFLLDTLDQRPRLGSCRFYRLGRPWQRMDDKMETRHPTILPGPRLC